MRDVVAAEWRKVFVGKALALMVLLAVVIGALAAVGYATDVDRLVASGESDMATITTQIVRSWFATLLFAALFGAILVTKEFGSGAIGRSVLLSGGRGVLFGAKLVAGTGVGVLFGLLAAGLAVASPYVVLLGTSHRAQWTEETTLTLIGVFVVTAVAAPWGVLIGWIVRNQAAAIGVLLGFALLVDEVLLRLVPAFGRFTMTIAMSAVYRDGKPELLPIPAASLVIAAWLAVAGLLAFQLVRTRDV
jgi:ABC-2 type transport system permease protein